MRGSRCVLLGAGGHARVVLDAMRAAGMALPECALDGRIGGGNLDGVPVLGGDELLNQMPGRGIQNFLLGMAGLGNSPLRPRIWEMALHAGLAPLTVIHPAATISPLAEIGQGAQVLGGAVINAGARIGSGSIVSTSAVVEHDCEIGSFCHLAPRCCLGGGVRLGNHCHIGLGAVVRESISIGEGTLVGAGAVVVGNLRAGCLAVGVPAREGKL